MILHEDLPPHQDQRLQSCGASMRKTHFTRQIVHHILARYFTDETTQAIVSCYKLLPFIQNQLVKLAYINLNHF